MPGDTDPVSGPGADEPGDGVREVIDELKVDVDGQ
jgi:hypothetical protein